MQADASALVFFDGLCSLCNRLVDVLMRIDKRQRLQFASLQGETAARLLPLSMQLANEKSTLIFRDRHGRLYQRSDAVIELLATLGGGWKLARILTGVPRGLRDGLYRWVARHRYQIWGQRPSCRVPTAAEQGHLLP